MRNFMTLYMPGANAIGRTLTMLNVGLAALAVFVAGNIIWPLVKPSPSPVVAEVKKSAEANTPAITEKAAKIKMYTEAPPKQVETQPVAVVGSENKVEEEEAGDFDTGDMKLTGLFANTGRPEASIAIISTGKEDVIVSPGDNVDDDITLESVYPDHVILRRGKKTASLNILDFGDAFVSKGLGAGSAEPMAAAPTASPEPPKSVTQQSIDEIMMGDVGKDGKPPPVDIMAAPGMAGEQLPPMDPLMMSRGGGMAGPPPMP